MAVIDAVLPLIPLLQFLAPQRLWLLLLIPALVGGYLLLSRRRASKRRSMGRTMFDLVIPQGPGLGAARRRRVCRS